MRSTFFHIILIFILTRCSLNALACTNYTVTVTSGAWPSEVSWELVNPANSVVSNGLAPSTTNLCLNDGCYTINLIDEFGDGWNGATITVTGPGNVVLISTTLADGFFDSVIVSLGGGDCCPSGSSTYVVNVTAGNFPGENSWELIDSGGNTVANGGAPAMQNICLTPGCYTMLLYDMFGDGWDGSVYTITSGVTTVSSGTLVTGDFMSVDFSVGGSSCAPTCGAGEFAYHLVITSDLFPNEVSWVLNDENGGAVVSGGSPASVYFCVHQGCYEMVMSDLFADGWSGASYTLYDQTGVSVQSGALDNGASETNVIEMAGADCGISNPVTASDCAVAVNVCDNLNFQIDPNGYGTTNEVPSPGALGNPLYGWNDGTPSPWGSDNFGCLRNGELNSTWMIVNIWQGGLLTFTFGGLGTQNGFYDWIMYPYDPSTTCQNIFNNLLPPVRCNWNLVMSGGTGLATTLPAGGNAGNYEPALNVLTGQQYLICFSNYSSVTTAVPLDFGGTAVVGCGLLVLPIELNSFQAKQQGSIVRLDWTTATENDNDYFVIEHSVDALNWRDIGRVEGAGISSVERHYEFVHSDPSDGRNYYRLRQVDFDGNSWMSDEQSVLFKSEGHTVFPNPNEGKFFIHSSCALVVTDITGRIQPTTQRFVSDEIIEIQMQQPREGIYLIRSGCDSQTTRVVVR